MCWSGEASTVLAVAGIGVTAYAIRRGEPPALWLTLGFFTIMEVLQAASYPVIDQCTNPANRALSIASFVHISLHPFFFNALALYFVPAAVRARIQVPVYAICAVAALVTLAQVVPVDRLGQCADHRGMCGTGFCTVSGTWHLAWEFPFNGWGNGFADHANPVFRLFPNALVAYSLAIFVLPLIYGAWRITLFQYAVGPGLVRLLSDNIDERPAIWCLMSIGIAVLIIFSPLRRALHTRRWWLWPKGMTAA